MTTLYLIVSAAAAVPLYLFAARPFLEPVPAALTAWLVAVNLATVHAYWGDKRRARLGRRRIPEKALLLLGLAGGSPAALAGMKLFRHKTAKARFLVKFWLLLVAQASLVVLAVRSR